MNDVPAENTGAPMMKFRKSYKNKPGLGADAASRQGAIARQAIESLGAEAAIAFLNSENAQLGARPLDVAMGSAAGFAQTTAELARYAASVRQGG